MSAPHNLRQNGRLHLVRFEPLGRSTLVATGASLLEGARRVGIDLASNCSGQGDCGQCGVIILEGEFSELFEEEEKALSREEIQAGWRLACCARVYSAARILIPKYS